MIICAAENCSKRPSFNYVGMRPKFCKAHKFYKMVNIKHKNYKKLYNNNNHYNDIMSIDDDINYILNLQIPTIIPKSNSSYSSKIFRDRQKKLLNFMTNHIEELHTLIYNNNIISTKVINDYINEYINEKIYILSQR